ncbi:MAG TPA: beta-galactosidase [Candidatus Hydrogenedentes bacterium]|nr:beta-galactosidase [Candidatus Hydrogenedentota bacterium]
MVLSAVLACAACLCAPTDDSVLFDFSSGKMPQAAATHQAEAVAAARRGGGLEVRFQTTEWPHVLFRPADGGVWDWSDRAGIAVQVFNPTDEAVDFSLRVDNAGADGWEACNSSNYSAPPNGRAVLKMRFKSSEADTLWGMRGVPALPPRGEGNVIDPSRITAFQVFLPRPAREHTLILERVSLFGSAGDAGVPMPFINRFGQYLHADWSGKLGREEDLQKRKRREERAWAKAPEVCERDRFGGWAKGPQLEATGWFRTQKVDGKWWLVTPEGRLFFSVGMDCVGTWEQTFVEKRGPWFEWLPAPDDPVFGGFFGEVKGVHSMAEPIGGGGRTFSFYRANLRRKHGEQWADRWRDSAYARLRHWGFNTLGNWSQGDVLADSPLPYVVSTGLWGVPKIEAARGYWAKMMDVFCPEFETAVDKALAGVAQSHADNPLCIGYFVDNELAWEGVVDGCLRSPAAQPARRELIAFLQERHKSLDALNAAWKSAFTDWDSVAPPTERGERFLEDTSDFLHHFARRYFETVQAAVRRHAPNQLYLGCRFSGAPDPVVRAAGETTDVVSFNLYQRRIPEGKWTDLIDRPALIGEFHFGALDRGMFHTGLVRTRDQKERAEAFARYVESVAAHPLFVGCHWFQYVDEPVTGRTHDGENYNIGFVDVTDTPYPELSEAARAINGKIYRLRAGG